MFQWLYGFSIVMVKGYRLYDLVVIGFKGKGIYILIVQANNDYMGYGSNLLEVKFLKDYRDQGLYDYELEITRVKNHENVFQGQGLYLLGVREIIRDMHPTGLKL